MSKTKSSRPEQKLTKDLIFKPWETLYNVAKCNEERQW